jgi:hypothetical protein
MVRVMTSAGKLKIEIAVPNFFFLPMRRMEIESRPETGRTYFVFGGKIVAVGNRGETNGTDASAAIDGR